MDMQANPIIKSLRRTTKRRELILLLLLQAEQINITLSYNTVGDIIKYNYKAEAWREIIHTLYKSDLVVRENNNLLLTLKGRLLAKELEKTLLKTIRKKWQILKGAYTK